MWSAPESLALRRMLPEMVLLFVMQLEVCFLMRLRRPGCRSDSLVNVGVAGVLVGCAEL